MALFLDADRQYSCAYFEAPDQSLDDAQLAKKRHLAAKLLITPASACSILEAAGAGLRSTSPRPQAPASPASRSRRSSLRSRVRAAERGLSGTAEFRLQDYRDVPDKFDRIVSVGMFEHVGVGFYEAFFRKCAALMEEDGVMVLHSIGRSEGPNVTNPWIAKYIFPGGYIPALSEVLPAIERAGLLVTDIEILRLHYAETLKAWRERFLAHREAVERLYDARFVRMWVLLRRLRDGLPRTGHDGFPGPVDQAPGRRPDHARLHCARDAALARARRRQAAVAAAGG